MQRFFVYIGISDQTYVTGACRSSRDTFGYNEAHCILSSYTKKSLVLCISLAGDDKLT